MNFLWNSQGFLLNFNRLGFCFKCHGPLQKKASNRVFTEAQVQYSRTRPMICMPEERGVQGYRKDKLKAGMPLGWPPAFHAGAGPLMSHSFPVEIALSLLCFLQNCPHDSPGERQRPAGRSRRHRKAVSHKTCSSHMW